MDDGGLATVRGPRTLFPESHIRANLADAIVVWTSMSLLTKCVSFKPDAALSPWRKSQQPQAGTRAMNEVAEYHFPHVLERGERRPVWVSTFAKYRYSKQELLNCTYKVTSPYLYMCVAVSMLTGTLIRGLFI